MSSRHHSSPINSYVFQSQLPFSYIPKLDTYTTDDLKTVYNQYSDF